MGGVKPKPTRTFPHHFGASGATLGGGVTYLLKRFPPISGNVNVSSDVTAAANPSNIFGESGAMRSVRSVFLACAGG